MGVEEFVPLAHMNQFFNVPLGILTAIVFFFGYITIRSAQKNNVITAKRGTVDDIFLMSASGTIIFLRVALPLLFITPIYQNPDLIKEYGNIAIIWLTGLIVFIIFSSLTDIDTIFKKDIFKLKQRGKKRWGKTEILISILFAIFLSYGVLSYGISYLSLTFLFMIFLAIAPSIHITISLVNKLH